MSVEKRWRYVGVGDVENDKRGRRLSNVKGCLRKEGKSKREGEGEGGWDAEGL